jgi:hypothetical protein
VEVFTSFVFWAMLYFGIGVRASDERGEREETERFGKGFHPLDSNEDLSRRFGPNPTTM